eukprot:10820773-Heterocapsa_arctica.AAC.1
MRSDAPAFIRRWSLRLRSSHCDWFDHSLPAVNFSVASTAFRVSLYCTLAAMLTLLSLIHI